MKAVLLGLACGLGLLLNCAAASAAPEPPRLIVVSPVTPDVLGLTVETGKVEYARQIPYVKQDGDVVSTPKTLTEPIWVNRDGKTIGCLVGRQKDILFTFDVLTGDPLDTKWADEPASYEISSTQDLEFKAHLTPRAVYRKTKPTDTAVTARQERAWPLRHVIYLKLPVPLKPGNAYDIHFKGGSLPDTAYKYEPSRQRSEAVHVSQIGFRPDDPGKIAFLSLWMGNGGGLKFTEGAQFQILDDTSGISVFSGQVTLAASADQKTGDIYKKNFNGTAVYQMEFGALSKPGRYRVYVEGVGCSYPFQIGVDAWRKAFQVSAKGLYTQRSGIPLGPPYSKFSRPKTFHPEAGFTIYQSTTSLMDSRNGLNARGSDPTNFHNLVMGKTEKAVAEAWGGYCDAGDWDRRIQHAEATRDLFELVELFPRYFEKVDLNLPESKDDLPDVVNEALWTLDFFRRLQTPDGGIRGGVESAEHPLRGEASWQESLPVMVYAPDMWCGYIYAGTAARAAHWLGKRKSAMAREYAESAVRAMEWAEAAFAKHDYAKLPYQVIDERNLAAAEMFRLTVEPRWNTIFLETTRLKDPAAPLAIYPQYEQRHAAFLYARCSRPGTDATVKGNARQAILREADASLEFQKTTGFKWTKQTMSDILGYGRLSVPQAMTLVRAHYLTKEPKYLEGIVLACQSGLGANPANLCYTTGLGGNYPLHPLFVDARVTGQPVPEGITVYGPWDVTRRPDHWMMKLLNEATFPAVTAWPSAEAYFDVYQFPETNEYVVTTLVQNAYVWGYLAARK